MSIENAKAFLEKVKNDEEFRKTVGEISSKEERMEFIKKAGFEFTKEELDVVTGELKANELEDVAGGGAYNSATSNMTPRQRGTLSGPIGCTDAAFCNEHKVPNEYHQYTGGFVSPPKGGSGFGDDVSIHGNNSGSDYCAVLNVPKTAAAKKKLTAVSFALCSFTLS